MKRKEKKEEEQEKKIVRLSNKTNSGLYELLEDNIGRDVKKISGPHRISSKREKEIYKWIGYNQDETNDDNTDETLTPSEENRQVIIDDEGEPTSIVINASPKRVMASDNNDKRSKDKLLNSGGIA